MAERVIVRQNSDFEIEFEALDPSEGESAEVRPVVEIHELTPYTMISQGRWISPTRWGKSPRRGATIHCW
jgi:hypothetical protein